MKQLVLFVAAIALLSCTTTDASAQRLLGRLFRVQPTQTYNYQPVVQRSYTPTFNSGYSYSPTVSNPVPRPLTGYGSNLHRNYMIRRAQQKAAITGIAPRNTGNIRWAR